MLKSLRSLMTFLWFDLEFFTVVFHDVLSLTLHVDAHGLPFRHPLVCTFSFPDGQLLTSVISMQNYTRILALLVVIADTIVGIKREIGIGSGIDADVERAVIACGSRFTFHAQR